MGAQAVFDVNKAIADWRRHLAEVSKISADDLDELQSHLRDHIEQLVEEGLSAQEAFGRAIVQLGDAAEIDGEFSKVCAGKFGLLAFVNGKVLTMADMNNSPQRILTWLLLFVGFSSITGWLGTNYILLTEFTNSRHFADFSATMGTILRSLITTSFFIVFAIVALGWGLRRLKRTSKKTGLLGWSAIPPIVLTPIFTLVGLGLILFAPFWAGHVKAVVTGPDIEQSVISPDGNFEAFVVNKPSIDPPNQHLYLRQLNILGRKNGKGYNRKIAQLPEDVDRIEKIHWSPYSDVVVFQSYFSLIAVGLPDYGMVKIPLGGREQWRDNGTFWVDYDNVMRIEAIEFPSPGAFGYRLEGSEKARVIQVHPI